MIRLILILVLLCGCSSSPKQTKIKNDFQFYADEMCQAINDKANFTYQDYFNSNFRLAINFEQLLQIFDSIHKQYGKCKKADIEISNPNAGKFTTTQHNGVKLSFAMSLVEEDEKKKIGGLFFRGPQLHPVELNSYSDLLEHLKKQSGKVSVLFKELNGKDYFSYHSNDRHAIGSVFKLYILATIMDKVVKHELSWDQEIEIEGSLKSLPSGEMQNLTDGTKIKLSEFALKMISISDNTATDHLLNLITKDEIEIFIQKNNLNSFVVDNFPFLSTLELFKIRAFFSQKEIAQYKKSSRASRMELIEDIDYDGQEDLMKKLESWTTPRSIDDIEWYASAADLSKLLSWLNVNADQTLLDILSANTPFVSSKSSKRWSYIGYKGGSEPGVLEMVYWLKDKSGKNFMLYIGQNDNKNSIDESKFFELVQGILLFVENN